MHSRISYLEFPGRGEKSKHSCRKRTFLLPRQGQSSNSSLVHRSGDSPDAEPPPAVGPSAYVFLYRQLGNGRLSCRDIGVSLLVQL